MCGFASAKTAYPNFPTPPESAGNSGGASSMDFEKAGPFTANPKMRILALTNLYPPHYLGGYELICQMVVHELRARGHEVQVLTSNHIVPGKPSAETEAGVVSTPPSPRP